MVRGVSITKIRPVYASATEPAFSAERGGFPSALQLPYRARPPMLKREEGLKMNVVSIGKEELWEKER
jgi:hypothetical protein